jgi:prepilin-type N-terminal cleavage/methylation domain-containing protein
MRLPSRNEKGYTLVEILVVIALVGILSGMAYSGFEGTLQRQRCIAAVNRIVSLLKEAQVVAREKRTRCYVAFNDTNGTVDLTLDTDYSGANAADGSDTLYRRVKINRQFRGANATVSTATAFLYDYRGVPSFPSGVPVISVANARKTTDTATITISNMGELSVALPAAWKR